jgi:hypothetical protein
MAASDFNLTPTLVEPQTPKVNIAVSSTDSGKKDYQLYTSTINKKYRLIFTGISDTNGKTIIDHYNARFGAYEAFDWLNANIPTYIKTLHGITSENMNVRWVTDSLKITMRDRIYMDIEIEVECT